MNASGRTTIGVAITTLSPVLLSTGPPASNLLETLEVISGNTLRGLLAARYQEKHGPLPVDELSPDKRFRRLFLSGETRFGFATLDGSQVVPISALTCKYYGGFYSDNGHGVVDQLIERVPGDHSVCANCGRSLDYFRGFWDPQGPQERRVQQRLITRTAIHPKLGTADPGRLYSQRVLAEDQTFQAIIEIPEDMEQEFKALLSGGFIGGIGLGRSRGQGWVQVTETQWTPPSWPPMAERYQKFRTLAGAPVLTITLLSESLVQDKFLRDTTAPTEYSLQNLLKDLDLKPTDWDLRPSRAFAATRLVSGFDGPPLRLPRIPRLAIAAGSAFLFQAATGNPQIPDGTGMGWLGERNLEGYGKVALWHPFHLEFHPEAKKEALHE